jgi:sugar-phosphatase
MIKAVIFDMDGVLINSEPFWQKTEVDLFAELGLRLTEEMQVETKGLRSDELIAYWYMRFPWSSPTPEELEKEYDRRMIDIFKNDVELMEGAKEAISFFSDQGIQIALASSSTMELIDICLDRFELRKYFSVIYSAEKELYGKPHPGVYLNTASLLNCDPTMCVAIEDSFHGLIAAKAARMKVIALPEPKDFNDPRYGAADQTISSLLKINKVIFDRQ